MVHFALRLAGFHLFGRESSCIPASPLVSPLGLWLRQWGSPNVPVAPAWFPASMGSLDMEAKDTGMTCGLRHPCGQLQLLPLPVAVSQEAGHTAGWQSPHPSRPRLGGGSHAPAFMGLSLRLLKGPGIAYFLYCMAFESSTKWTFQPWLGLLLLKLTCLLSLK